MAYNCINNRKRNEEIRKRTLMFREAEKKVLLLMASPLSKISGGLFFAAMLTLKVNYYLYFHKCITLFHMIISYLKARL